MVFCISAGAVPCERLQIWKKALKMKIGTLSRREREKLRQRSDMLNAALKLFSKKGYQKETYFSASAAGSASDCFKRKLARGSRPFCLAIFALVLFLGLYFS